MLSVTSEFKKVSVDEPTGLQQAINRLKNITDDIDIHTLNLESAVERLQSRQEDGQGKSIGSPVPTPTGYLEVLNDALDRLGYLNGRQSTALNTLSKHI